MLKADFIFPAIFVVTLITLFPLFPPVGVIEFVAGITGHFRFSFKDVPLVTGSTFSLLVLTT